MIFIADTEPSLALLLREVTQRYGRDYRIVAGPTAEAGRSGSGRAWVGPSRPGPTPAWDWTTPIGTCCVPSTAVAGVR